MNNKKTNAIKIITPSQYFDDEIACTTVCINEYSGGKIEEKMFLITSNKEKISLSNESLSLNNFVLERECSFSNSWNKDDFEKFIKEKKSNQLFEEIFNLIEKKIKELIIFEDEKYFSLISCWIIGTYFHRLMNSFPYLHFNGSAACGKTKVISFISVLAFLGKHSTNTTPAALIRGIHGDHITCCIDESEKLGRGRGEDNQALLSMLNSGYKKGSFTEKCEKTKSGKFKIIKFDSYSPKVFAGIKKLDSVLATRCIPIIMPPIKITNTDVLYRDIEIDDKTWSFLRNKLYALMLTRFKDVRKEYKNLEPIEKNMNPRDWELWKPVLTIGKLINDNVFSELKELIQESKKLKSSTNEDAEFQISFLECTLDMINNDNNLEEYYPVSQIKNALTNSCRDEFHWVQDKPNNQWIGDLLRKLGIVKGQSEQKKIESRNQRCFKLSKKLVEKRLNALSS